MKCLAPEPADRYADAGSVAMDLRTIPESFSPFSLPANPSRGERFGELLVRKAARRLTQVGIVGAAFLILGTLLVRPVRDWLTPTEPSNSEFQSAVDAVERGNPTESAKILSNIVQAFPRSCLARFYLAFALKNVRNGEYDAKRYLREALAISDAENIVVDWSKKHAEFCPLLVEFVDSGIADADEFVQKYDKDDPEREAELDSELRKPGYELFHPALVLAEKLDPESQRVQRLLATTEAIFGDYESSYQRLSRLIKLLSKSPDSDVTVLFFCRQLRGRVGFLWIEQQRDDGDQLSEQTIEFLKAAVDDLTKCKTSLEFKVLSEADGLKKYRIAHDLLRATLTLAEVEMDLNRLDRIDKRLEKAGELMSDLRDAVRAAGLDESTITGLKRRLEAAINRRTTAIASPVCR